VKEEFVWERSVIFDFNGLVEFSMFGFEGKGEKVANSDVEKPGKVQRFRGFWAARVAPPGLGAGR
jgi:hypothetical protein